MRAVFTTALFPGRCLEERVTEDTVIPRSPVQGLNTPLPCLPCHQALLQYFRADSLDHGSEGQFREPFHQCRAGGIHINHPRQDTDIPEPGRGHKRVQLPADQGIAARSLLEFHEAADSPAGICMVRVKVC